MYGEYLTSISAGDNLLGIVMDIEIHLEMSDIFENVKVASTDDMNCLIEATCTFSRNNNEEEIKNYFIELWKNQLRYQEFEKHHCKIEDKKIVLYFFTSTTGLGVTGKITASCT